jgi:hypothetical protein
MLKARNRTLDMKAVTEMQKTDNEAGDRYAEHRH